MRYHGSGVGGLTERIPHIAGRAKEMVYLTDDVVIATRYTVNAAGRPYYYFPYGFERGLPVYTEYYPDGLADVYRGKCGDVYRCETNAGFLPKAFRRLGENKAVKEALAALPETGPARRHEVSLKIESIPVRSPQAYELAGNAPGFW